jgi:hypothetical protein
MKILKTIAATKKITGIFKVLFVDLSPYYILPKFFMYEKNIFHCFIPAVCCNRF